MSEKEKKDFEARAHNLAQILETDFFGDMEAFCKQLGGLKKETLVKFLNPRSDRPCKDRAARRIEAQLGKSPHTLDNHYKDQVDIHYVALSTNMNYTYEIVDILRAEESIKECSTLLGDIDILIKLEAKSSVDLDKLLGKLVRLPGVKSHKTYNIMKGLRWQREQVADMTLPSRSSQTYFKNGIERYINDQMTHYLGKVKEYSREEILIRGDDLSSFESSQVIEGARASIKALRTPDEKLNKFSDCIDLEKSLITDGVQSQRIILLPNTYQSQWERYLEDYNQFHEIGSQVRFLTIEEWGKSLPGRLDDHFVVVDNEFVCIRPKKEEYITINKNEEVVARYTELFDINWRKGLTLKEVQSNI